MIAVLLGFGWVGRRFFAGDGILERWLDQNKKTTEALVRSVDNGSEFVKKFDSWVDHDNEFKDSQKQTINCIRAEQDRFIRAQRGVMRRSIRTLRLAIERLDFPNKSEIERQLRELDDTITGRKPEDGF